jgi:hypothetical protein
VLREDDAFAIGALDLLSGRQTRRWCVEPTALFLRRMFRARRLNDMVANGH